MRKTFFGLLKTNQNDVWHFTKVSKVIWPGKCNLGDFKLVHTIKYLAIKMEGYIIFGSVLLLSLSCVILPSKKHSSLH